MTDALAQAVEVRPLDPADHPAAHALRVAAFSSSLATRYPEEGEANYIPADSRLGAYDGDRLVGHTGVWSLGQWLGGRQVPMAGVASVTVAADQRRRGIAGRLVRAALELARTRGDVIACLYPTVPALYRWSGFEFAGVHIRHVLPPGTLGGLPRPSAPPRLRRLAYPDDLPGIAPVWDAAAQAHGRETRSDARLRHIFEPDDARTRDLDALVAERDGTITGVLQVSRSATPPGDRSIFTQRVVGLAATDRDTWLALWHVVAGQASVCARTQFTGAPHEPLLDELSVPAHDLDTEVHPWMARLVDLPTAVAGRGWPAGAPTAISLGVHDPLLAANDGTWTLEVADGEGRLTRGGPDAAPTIDVGALSALFTGHVRARTLAFQGRLSGASAADVATLDAVFGAPQPWFHDYF